MLSPFSKHIPFCETGHNYNNFQTQLDMIPDVVSLFTKAINEDKIEPNTIIGVNSKSY